MLCKAAAPEAKTLPHQLHNQLQGRSLWRSLDGNSASYQPSTGNKQGIYCLLAFTGANCAQFDFPRLSFRSVNKEITLKNLTLGRLSPVDTTLIWESYCPFEMLNKPVGCWDNSERKWERQKQNKMLCNGMH